MESHRRTAPTAPRCAAESDGVYEATPLARMASAVERYEAVKRELLDAWRDVTAEGGTLVTTGLTQSEWLTLHARLSGADEYRLGLLTRRLPAVPVTAALLAAGEVTVDQAATICAATTRLSGERLARVERSAAEEAADRNRRGDHPDIGPDVELLVQQARRPVDQERIERRRLDGARAWAQQDLDGGGRITADLDAVGFATTWSAIEEAAGRPAPDEPRSRQRAEGLVAMAAAWLGAADAPDHEGTDTPPGGRARPRLGAAVARPTIVLKVDTTTATDSTFAAVWRVGRGRRAPMLSARLADALACDATVAGVVAAGARPLAELRRQPSLPVQVRRQVLLRDMGCRWPGCTAPPWQADVHHVRHRADGGGHAVDNLVSLCRRHHVRLHSAHWHASLDGATARFELRRTAGGTVHHTSLPHDRHQLAPPPDVQQLH